MADGLSVGLPVCIGYIPAAMAFGSLAKVEGFSLTDGFLFSSVVFAGASQFMALHLLRLGVGFGQIVLATFLLNFRHFFMSASLSTRLHKDSGRWLPLVAFGVTDETFSVAATRREDLTVPFLLALEGLAYSAWVAGTVLGYLVASKLPQSVQASMQVALYAMFISILAPEARASWKVVALAAGAGIINALLTSLGLMASGWTLIVAVIVSAALGTLVFEDTREDVRA
jgi:4-azaleucine resistance transporter AzlC